MPAQVYVKGCGGNLRSNTDAVQCQHTVLGKQAAEAPLHPGQPAFSPLHPLLGLLAYSHANQFNNTILENLKYILSAAKIPNLHINAFCTVAFPVKMNI